MSFIDAHIVGENVSYAEYSKQTCKRGEAGYVMSRGELMAFVECPSKWVNGPRIEAVLEAAGFPVARKETPEMIWGRLVDCIVTQPDNFHNLFAVAPSTYPCEPTKRDPRTEKPWNNNADYCREWKAEREADGKTVITPEWNYLAALAVGSVWDDEEIAELIRCSKKQVMVKATYRDKESELEIPVVTLVDLVPDVAHRKYGKSLGDFKTGQSAKPEDWQKQVNRYNYDAQGALYLDIYKEATGEDRCDFRHAIQENAPPFQTARRILSSENIDCGRMKYTHALTYYCRCLAENVWPDYEATERENIGGWSITHPTERAIMQTAERTLPMLCSKDPLEHTEDPQPEGITP